jgi:plastocyanin
MTRLMRVVLVGVGVAVMAWLPASPALAGGGGGGECVQPSPAPMSGQAGWVAVLDYCFSPQTIDASTGDTIRWEFDGATAHTVSFGNSVASTPLQGGQSFAVRFNQAGTYDYYCTIHPGMTGTVQVTGANKSGPDIQAVASGGQTTAAKRSATMTLTDASPLRLEFSPLTAVVLLLVLFPLSTSAALALVGVRSPRGGRLRLRFPVHIDRPPAPRGRR